MTHELATMRPDRAKLYSPIAFVRGCEDALAQDVNAGLSHALDHKLSFRAGSHSTYAIVRFLEWDSDYFRCPTYRIDCCDWEPSIPDQVHALARTVSDAQTSLHLRHDYYYLFAEVPSEDTVVLQAMGAARFRLIETRLTYYMDHVRQFEPKKRYPVRSATEDDIVDLRRVASEARNAFDRFHADDFFSAETADEFLATFAENSVRGFSGITIVPDVDENPPGAFLTGDFMPELSGCCGKQVARMVLSAVSTARRGWYQRLVSELVCWFRDHETDLIYLTTQSTNRPVVRVWENLGFRYGRATHILACTGSGTCVRHEQH